MPQQVAERLRYGMLLCRWKGRLPGRDLLAEKLNLNPRSVQKALKIQERERLLIPQEPGKRCRIELPKHQPVPTLQIAIQAHKSLPPTYRFMAGLHHRPLVGGHKAFFAKRTLSELGMDVARIARSAKETPSDARIVAGTSHGKLTWFAGRDISVFALAWIRKGLQIAGAGHDYELSVRVLVRRL